ncbi:MAG TPA: NAD(P)H-binding protein [Puia sp.]
MKYTLIGSLGHINTPLAKQLIAAGHTVTIVSSNPDRTSQIAALGAKAAIGSIEDIPFLTKVFTGADALYTMIPPNNNPTDWNRWIQGIGRNFATAIKASGVKKVVNLSSIGAHMPKGCGPVSGLYGAEQELNTLEGVDLIHLRPGYFYTNLLHSIDMIKHAGIFGNNFGADTTVIMTHPRDIAAVAAEELTGLTFTGKSYRYIASDERTSAQIAAALGAAIGNPNLPYVAFSDEDYFNGAVKAGLPAEIARNYTEMGDAIRSGEMFADYRLHKVALGPTKLTDFAKEFAAAYAH